MTKGRRKLAKINKYTMILTIAIIFWAIYFLSIGVANPIYLNMKNTDPLAMIRSLFPLYYMAVALFVFFCFGCVLFRIRNKYIHIALLVQLSVMLWLTPYYLSGFSYVNDSLYHVGVSSNIPEVLKGYVTSDIYDYGKDYPLSFVFNNLFMEISGVDPFTYAYLIYPTLYVITIILLLYAFISRFLEHRVAFLSIIFAILGLGYVAQIHVSPRSAGTILLLVAVILLISFRDIKSHALGLLVSFLMIATHPISPLILVLFCLALYITKFASRHVRSWFSTSGIISIFVAWFAYTFFAITRRGADIAEALYKIVTLEFATELQDITTRASSVHYLYPEINILSKIVDYSILIIALILIGHLIAIFYSIGLDPTKGRKELLLEVRSKIRFEELFFLATALLCFPFSILLNLSGQGVGGLYERSYFYFVFTIAVYIGLNVQGKKICSLRRTWKKYLMFSLVVWFTFIALIYPLKAYPNYSYEAYPPSEGLGMQFVSSSVRLNGKTISMYLYFQLASYISPETHFSSDYYELSDFSVSKPYPEIIVFRKSMYFDIALRYDLSLNDNRYLQAISEVNNLTDFNRVYSNPTFNVYIKTFG